MAKLTSSDVLFSCLFKLGLVFWLGFDNLFVSQNLIEFCMSYFLEQILIFASTICLYGQILVTCAQFPVDQLLHTVVPGLVLFLCQFTVITHVIGYFISPSLSLSLSPTLSILPSFTCHFYYLIHSLIISRKE